MKEVYRFEDNQDYWDRRWAETRSDPDRFETLDIYPIKYAEMVMGDPNLHSVELGAGLGRVLKHYYFQGYKNIIGVERSPVAVEQQKQAHPDLDIREGDVLDLCFEDGAFDILMAFGLYHNIPGETSLNKALAETARCLRINGRFCISMRPNNFEMNANEYYWRWKRGKEAKGDPQFHKWLVGKKDFVALLSKHGLHTQEVFYARNFPILYRFPFLRAKSHNETERRGQGYRLNLVGRFFDRILTGLFPSQFCNVLVVIGTRVATTTG